MNIKKELPIKIQTILYRVENGVLLVLIIKRSPQDGGFWQTITGTLELNESITDSRQRELKEEVGIIDAIYDDAEVNRFAWQKKDWIVVEIVFSAETGSKDVVLNFEEHTEYKWLRIDEAIALAEKDQTKECLTKFKNIKLMDKSILL